MENFEELEKYLNDNKLSQVEFSLIANVDNSLVSKWLKNKRSIPNYILEYIRGNSKTIKNNSFTQKQTRKVFGLTPSTKFCWSNLNNSKHNLYLLVDSLSYEEALKLVIKIKKERGYEHIKEKKLLNDFKDEKRSKNN